MRFSALPPVALVALASSSLAQTVKQCPSSVPGLCYSVNVPDASASSGNGDIFFQIQGPSSKSWLALGQGSQMSGSNIFVIYASADGKNVTLSPRAGTGHVMPKHDTTAQATLLEGSGIAGGQMTANVRCSNCATWQGGSMNFASSNTDWIWAAKSGSPLNSDDASATISMHDNMDEITLDLTKARGGSSLNPFVDSSTSAAATTSASAPAASGSAASSSSENAGGVAGPESGATGYTLTPAQIADLKRHQRALIAHGCLMALAFVIFYPLGGILVRLLHVKGTVWIHAGVQAFAYTLTIAGMGCGVYVTGPYGYNLDHKHTIIGLTVIAAFFIQPFFGVIHHAVFKKTGRRSFWSDIHVWFGRLVLTLGIINGGLGFDWAANTTGGEIAYGVVAGVVWVGWIGVAVWSDVKRLRGGAGGGGGGEGGQREKGSQASESDG